MLRSRYRRSRYGQFPWWAAVLAGVLWLTLTVAEHLLNREHAALGEEDVYLLYVDRNLRIMESGEDLGGLGQWLTGADEPLETLVGLRQTMERLAASDQLSAEAGVCLALLQYETGQEEEARASLDLVSPESTAGRVLSGIVGAEEPDEAEVDELRSQVEGGSIYAWEARIMALVENPDFASDPNTWFNHRGVNATMLSRIRFLFAVDCLVLLSGLVCVPYAFRELRHRRPSALPRIMGRWRPSFVLGWFFAIEVLVNFLAAVHALLSSFIYSEDMSYYVFFSMWAVHVLLSQGYVALLLAAVLFARPWHAFKASRITGPVPWAALLTALSLMGILHLLASVFLDLERVVDPSDFLIWSEVGILEFLFIFLSGCVAAPLFEEFVYRGVLFLGLRGRIGNVPALVLSSVVFAAAHAQYEWEGLISVGVFGAFCGLLAWRTGSILPGIVLHAGYNALIFGNTFLIYQFELGLPDY